MKKIIKLIILLIIIVFGWLGYQQWASFKPVLAKLEEKHPEKYEQMWEKAKSFNISEAKKLYRELKEMPMFPPSIVFELCFLKISANNLTTVDFPFDPVIAMISPLVYHDANSISLIIGIDFFSTFFIKLFFLQSIPGLIIIKSQSFNLSGYLTKYIFTFLRYF